ncbi:MAG: bifunctional (p)ppGpp synthetase/guanosine-3',5'-bis(diphosphate) 3'-pyrophosphohydrolase [Candidatus Caenarcaniphilales bacterium]|nr:bifunctional (p)ppGpp synthetase/guanosine-3',5'-bis(diphosphate) 3'-pyrophosphohydrolase [Candidatus Caenarcaniphilales bacterium]
MNDLEKQFNSDQAAKNFRERVTSIDPAVNKKKVDDLHKQLLDKLEARDYTENEIQIIDKAFEIANQAHEGQYRRSGEPYIIHPINVAIILSEIDADPETICAGLLHDVLEDTSLTSQELEKAFGLEVKDLVEGVTKLNKLSFASKREEHAENFRKMVLAIASDLRVVLVKLADRLHNMQTLSFMPEKKQQEIARETIEIFAPLANRFGLGHIKWQLEDLSFRYLNGEDYRRIEKIVSENRNNRESYLNRLISLIDRELKQASIPADTTGRVKHFYSIHSKLKRLQTEEIFDLLAIRIIVEQERQCYEVLGVIHDMFRPIPGRFKDYIAIPKSNMYQSLHTTIIGPEEKLVEVQIRTYEMHRIAEFGVAAHWKYKEQGKSMRSSSNYDSQLSQLRQKLFEMQLELPDAGDYSKAVQIDFLADEIFVLSPKGDVYRLPRNSTPVDFAYHVHSEIGNHCVGGKVNERLVTLDHRLKNGDIVEIQTNKNAHPSSDWLNFVQGSSTKSKIKQWFKKNRRHEYIDSGRAMLSEALGRGTFEDLLKKGALKQVSAKMGINSEDELFVRLSSADISTAQILGRLKNEGFIQKETQELSDEDYIAKGKRRKSSVSEIQSLKNLLHSFAKCCQPIPGENIMGVISRGRGVVVHREDCPNVKGFDEKRLIAVSWGSNVGNNISGEPSSKQSFATTLEIECIDRIGISRDVLDKIANEKLNILDIRVITRPTRQTALVRVSVEVQDINVLNKLIQSIMKLSDVLGIKRYTLRAGSKSPKQ